MLDKARLQADRQDAVQVAQALAAGGKLPAPRALAEMGSGDEAWALDELAVSPEDLMRLEISPDGHRPASILHWGAIEARQHPPHWQGWHTYALLLDAPAMFPAYLRDTALRAAQGLPAGVELHARRLDGTPNTARGLYITVQQP